MRAGQYVKQTTGFAAFVPASLPPDPSVRLDPDLTRLLSDADRALGRLDGMATVLPNPNLFVAMYVRQEAVLSSQIEGTQSSLDGVLQFEIDAKGRDFPKDVEEVVNYVKAMNYGLDRLKVLPLSLRLIREIHAQLLEGVRGAERTPGAFRRSQNWSGPSGCTLANATFVPPPVHEMHGALDNLENFLHEAQTLPVLVHCGLAHAQFETIHPFLDGNGRVGRLLITFRSNRIRPDSIHLRVGCKWISGALWANGTWAARRRCSAPRRARLFFASMRGIYISCWDLARTASPSGSACCWMATHRWVMQE
jgi:Fic/DOC family N-terminal/Fic/DOC family